MKSFWQVFKKTDAKQFDIIGLSNDDTTLTNDTYRLQLEGHKVSCETIDGHVSREEIVAQFQKLGYLQKAGLYESMAARLRSDEARSKSTDLEEPQSTEDHGKSYKKYSSTAQRITSPRQHIDAGFINRRKCFSAFGIGYTKAFEQVKVTGSDHLSELMNDHYMIHLALEYCQAHSIPTLGELLFSLEPNRLFCSTEEVLGCGDIVYHRKRASNEIRLSYSFDKRIYIEYHTDHIYADTQRLMLSKGQKTSIIGEISEVNKYKVIIHPIIMGPPTFDHPENKSIPFDLTWSGWNHYELFPEDIDEFAKCKETEIGAPAEWMSYMKTISELDVKAKFCRILGDVPTKDWGGEPYDHFTSHLHLSGKRVKAAFVLKGPAAFEEMKPKHLGKNADQICRLAKSDANVLIVQHCHQIGEAVSDTLRAFAVNPSNPRHYCLIDGRDTFKIFKAYGYL